VGDASKAAKLVRCFKCVLTYHKKCLPSSGYELFPGDLNLMICEKHPREMGMLRKRKIDECCEEEGLSEGAKYVGFRV
jgi:hypothetical protein